MATIFDAEIVQLLPIGGPSTRSDSIVSRPHMPHDAFVMTFRRAANTRIDLGRRGCPSASH